MGKILYFRKLRVAVADEALWSCLLFVRINEIDSIFAPSKLYSIKIETLRLKKTLIFLPRMHEFILI